ncbi:hypothetical protein OIE62_18765 [Streptomyces scopuliridis]|uniref:Uncharacterized protein n=1 Tax=Streptomyces scopuliridis TaxID=452529 RepID=A0ACD4ZMP4_9ACTN|nr:hypothetical protein [Streptomyces scopuliridis]WSB35208.1 hypothetical protein OG949_21695 [Streptomyces scopuliridis]WSB99450.1 hypothetical protein OG835_22185 [Streptomyces scopuliridis]WSC06849.1 hypothetical protein OIE62_18765 [Streptomyces scopuliridis]
MEFPERTETSSDALAAVLYVCVRAGQSISELSEQRAVEEGHSCAGKRGLRFVAEVTDPYGEPVPQEREGWLRVREMAQRGEVTSVVTRWPNAISPYHSLRYAEISWLRERRVRVLFSWPPLSVLGGEGA